MSFNSFLFLFGFLPAALIGYYVLALTPLHKLRLPFLVLATIVFYARGAAGFLPVLLASVALNYLVGWLIARCGEGAAAKWWLRIGVGGNVLALVWFKYAAFLIGNVAAAFAVDFAFAAVALPLAISFYTFQQISFLVDLSRKRIALPTPLQYASFILFFPQLLSGPISLSREIVPQMAERPARRAVPTHLLVGLTIFGIGLFKKTVIADTLALWTGPVFDNAATGAHPGLLAAWGGALAYTLQLYFDFSGYSDMAIGIARMFGIVLPANFHSPLKSGSIVEFWRRWHITLGRFVQAYIFQPMAVPLARLSANRGWGGNADFVATTAVPLFLSMLILGLWHGANWTFAVFGVMQGIYMVTNETWNRVMKKRRQKGAKPPNRVPGAALTLIAFSLSCVPFRAADVETAGRIWAGMAGMNGGAGAWNAWPVLTPLGPWGLYATLAAAFAVAYLMPNTQQIMTRVTPVLEWPKWRKVDPPARPIEWKPTLAWAAAGGAVLMIGMIFIARGTTQFVYFNF